MLTEVGILIGGKLIHDINKSVKMDEQAVKKNSKAFALAADAKRKVQVHQEDMEQALVVNATRKKAILDCHLERFRQVYETIQKIEFQVGRGIKEMEELDTINEQLVRYVRQPKILDKKMMTDGQMVLSIVRNGILGGLLGGPVGMLAVGMGKSMIQDSEDNLRLASKNMSVSRVASAQADSICIAYDGIRDRAKICTELLQKLAAIYMKGIVQVQKILDKNGMDEEKYTDTDADAINACLLLTKLVYRIVNTPLIDDGGGVTAESFRVIEEGQAYLNQIG